MNVFGIGINCIHFAVVIIDNASDILVQKYDFLVKLQKQTANEVMRSFSVDAIFSTAVVLLKNEVKIRFFPINSTE